MIISILYPPPYHYNTVLVMNLKLQAKTGRQGERRQKIKWKVYLERGNESMNKKKESIPSPLISIKLG